MPDVKNVIVVNRTGGKINWFEDRDLWFHELKDKVDDVCEPEPMDSEDPLFILYTSGSTGKPKGVLHTTAGYLLEHISLLSIYLDSTKMINIGVQQMLAGLLDILIFFMAPYQMGLLHLCLKACLHIQLHPDVGKYAMSMK